jgi:hypothetical protein
MQYFKDIHTYKAAILKHDKIINGKKFPAGSIIVIDDYYSSFGESSDIYVCTKLPHNYNGNNPTLTLWTYNEFTGFWERDIFQNKVTRMIWSAYVKTGKRKINTDNFITDEQAVDMMKCKNTVHKSGSGTRINNNTINNPVQYKQVTSYAYWANLYDVKSGNASVVASNIR